MSILLFSIGEETDTEYMQAAENGDTKTAQKLVDDVMYDLVVNEQKERTDKWLKALGLQLPSAITKYGSINNISENSKNVNTAFSIGENTRYSIEGRKSHSKT